MIRCVSLSSIFIIVFVLKLAAQNDLLLDDYMFSCIEEPENIKLSLEQGAQSFVFNLDKSKNANIFFTKLEPVISSFEKNHQKLLILVFTGDYDKENLISVLKAKFKDQIFYREDLKEWPIKTTLISGGKKVIALFNDDHAFTSAQIIRTERTYGKRFTSDPLNKMIIYKPDTTYNLYQQCLTMWEKTGKVPNLVLLPASELEKSKTTIDSLNKTRRFKGVVIYNNEYLNEIYWKQMPGLITSGKFSYPILENTKILSPYKIGYNITPGQIIHHAGMREIPRIFNAYDSSIDDKLVMHFEFEGSVVNQREPEWNKIISKDISIVKDQIRGKVIYFGKNNSFVDYSKENNLNFDSPITVAMWVRPDSIPPFMGIIGFGTSFSIKLNNGRLDFTTATIKDYFANKPLKRNEWSHAAVVFNPNLTVEFFINGQKIEVLNASEIKATKQSLIIGNNIWGEQFYGAIDDLKIWDRGLSEKEIIDVFRSKNKISSEDNIWQNVLFAGIAFFVLGFLFFIIIRKKRKVIIPERVQIPQLTDNFSGNIINLFGNFHIHSEHEGDISSRFSPLLKQMLSFFILSKNEKEERVSIKKLSDTFWPGASKDKAKENRGTNLKKLRKLLENIDGLKIIYKDKYWFLQHEKQVFIDIFDFNRLKIELSNQLAEGEPNNESILKLLEILKEGNILQDIDTEWLDTFKNKISTEVVDLLLAIYKEHKNKLGHHQAALGKTILKFDNLNEDALKIILLALSSQGNHGQAQQTYYEFVKKYVLLYNEEYPLDYQEIIRNS